MLDRDWLAQAQAVDEMVTLPIRALAPTLFDLTKRERGYHGMLQGDRERIFAC